MVGFLNVRFTGGPPWKRRFLLETIIFRGELLVLGRVYKVVGLNVRFTAN